MTRSRLKVGYFSFAPGSNPYHVARRGDVPIIAGETASWGHQKQRAPLAGAARRPGIRIEVRKELLAEACLQVYSTACDVVTFPFRDILSSDHSTLAMSFGCAVVARMTVA